jgi:hypothetical protein
VITIGILVTADVQSRLIRGSWYHGPCFGQPWPLEFIDHADLSEEVASLNAEICEHYERWDKSVAVVPSPSLVGRYVRVCRTRGIGTRVLLLSSESINGVSTPNVPTMTDTDALYLFRNSPELGFDFCAPWLDFSIIEMDINDGRFPGLSGFKSRLNQYGMFETVADLDGYIRARRLIQAQSNESLEDDDGCVAFRVQEVSQRAMDVDA